MRSRTGWCIILVGGGLIVLVAMSQPMIDWARPSAYRAPCQSQLKQIGLAIAQYTQDYDGKYPHVATGGFAYGWADVLQPYLVTTALYQCPLESDTTPGTNPRAPGYTDYWFNGNFSGRNIQPLSDPSLVILLGEGNTGKEWTDARYAKTQFPTAWLQDESSPAYRHIGTMNVAFADGHVKSYRPESIAPFIGPHLTLIAPVPTPQPEYSRN